MQKGSKGVLYMTGAVVAFALMSTLVKNATTVNTCVITFFRFMTGLGLLGTLALTGQIKLNFINKPLLLLRGISGSLAVFLFYLAITKIGIGKGTVFIYSYPIFAAILSTFILKEHISKIKWILIFCAFCGIILLSASKQSDSLLTTFSVFELLALAGAIFSAISVVLVKKLHDTETSPNIFFAQTAIGFWVFILPANLPPPTPIDFPLWLLLAIGVTSVAAQLLMTEGYRYIPVSSGALIMMCVPVVNTLLGIIIYQEAMNVLEILGAAMVICSSMGIIIFSRKKTLIKIKS